MATVTRLKPSIGYYGYASNGSYSNAGTHLYVGGLYGSTNYVYRSRLTFPPLSSVADTGGSRIVITKAVLHLCLNDGGPVNATAGSSSSSAWGAALAGTGTAYISAYTDSSAAWKSIDVSSCADAIAEYASNWYMHISGDAIATSDLPRFNGAKSSSAPYLELTWEYAANTIASNQSTATLGRSITFTITPEVSGEYHELTYSIGDASGTITSYGGNTVYWTPPVSLASEMPNSDFGMIAIRMTAYTSAGVKLRTELYYQSVTIPASVAPVIPSDGLTVALANGLSGYGLAGKSHVTVTPRIDMNSAYGSTLASVIATIEIGGTAQTIQWTALNESGAGVFVGAAVDGAVFATNGTALITLTATDSRGVSATASRSITVCAYSPPVISDFTIERYEVVYDANEEVSGYQASDLGGYIWVNMTASVSSIIPAGYQLNALRWTITAENLETHDIVTASGSAALSANIAQDRTIFPNPVGEGESWQYTLAVSDNAGSSVLQYDTIAPGRANLSLAPDKYGVAVGMIAGGTKAAPKFEVAETYESHFYGGIFGADGRRLDARSIQVHEFADAELSANGWQIWAADHRPRVTRVGDVVTLSGAVQPVASIAGGSTRVTLFTLPDWAWPMMRMLYVFPGSGTNIYNLRINWDGPVEFYGHRSGSSYANLAAGVSIFFSATWIAADAIEAQTT